MTISQKLLLVTGSVLVAIVVAEGVARVIGFTPQFGQVPVVEDAPTRKVDGVLLWSEKEPRTTPEDVRQAAANPDAFTILGLGDSILYGVGQAKSGTYLEQMRRALGGRSPRPVQVLNLAVPGYNTLQESAVYKEIEGEIAPDLVLVHYWGDDSAQYRVVGGYVVDLAEKSGDGRLVARVLPIPASVNDFLLRHSRLYDLLMQVLVSRQRNQEVASFAPVATPLIEIHERARRHGGRLLVLASVELDKPYPQPTQGLPTLQALAAEHGFEVIDLSEWLRGIESSRIAMDPCHFNAEGHRILGERLAEYLLAHDLNDETRAVRDQKGPRS